MALEDDLNNLDTQIVDVLVSRLESTPSTIEYGELLAALKKRGFFNGVENPHFLFNKPLGRVQEACDRWQLPCLPAMVVLKKADKTTEPGEGFADEYRRRHPEDRELSNKELFEREWSKVKACNDWQLLLDITK